MSISKELVIKAVPPNLKNAVSDDLVDRLNAITSDQILAEEVRNNFISYASVLREGKFKLEDYLNAVTYVSHRLNGDTQHDAYFKTFPSRYQNLMALGKTPKEISNYVAMFNKGKLVQKIQEQTLTPAWVMNQDMFQAALNTNYQIMMDDDVSPKVRVEAANSLLTHLQKPKEVTPAVNIDLRESSGLSELKKALGQLATQQQQLIEQGGSTRDVAAQRIIDVSAQEVEDVG
jgi:hypothetical protein